MPTISVAKTPFLKAIDWVNATDENIRTLCFDFGIELDDIVDPKEERCAAALMGGERTAQDAPAVVYDDNDLIYKIDIPANRYDLLCFEGIVQAFRVFLQKSPSPEYILSSPETRQRLVVDKSTAAIRPFAFAAVLRDVKFTPESFRSFIDLQDKLHQNIGRKRTLVAIGTHDLSTIQGPFTYSAKNPDDFHFVALNRSEDTTARELMNVYATNDRYLHLRPYLPIIQDSPVYPVIEDSNGVVLSMPPIINGNHSAMTVDTRDVFIEVTATDRTRAQIAINMVVTMFCRYCAKPFTIEPVDVVYPNGEVVVTPAIAVKEHTITMKQVRRLVNIPGMTSNDAATLLTRMMLDASVSPSDNNTITVRVPPTRPDILHACDIAEDVAVAYGFDNVPRLIPQTGCPGVMQPLNKLTDHLRAQMAMAGFTELLNFALVSHDDNSTHLQRPVDPDTPSTHAVRIANPKTLEFQELRTSIIPGMLKTCANNLGMPLPLRLFETGDVVLRQEDAETRTRNERHLAALHMGHKADFQIIHGLLDRTMQVLDIPYGKDLPNGYYLEACPSDKLFFAGQGASIMVRGRKAGVIGTVHPDVMKNFKIALPCSLFELSIQDIFKQE